MSNLSMPWPHLSFQCSVVPAKSVCSAFEKSAQRTPLQNVLTIWTAATASNINYLSWKNYFCLHPLQNILKEFFLKKEIEIQFNNLHHRSSKSTVLTISYAFQRLYLSSMQFPAWNPLSYLSHVQSCQSFKT